MTELWIIDREDESEPGTCSTGKLFGWRLDATDQDAIAIFSTEREAKKTGFAMRPDRFTIWQLFVGKADVIRYAREHHVHGPSAPGICRYRAAHAWEKETDPVIFLRGKFYR